ncbi:ABC-2 transporter permease [Bifidobacterium parmae]|uniref:ABC-2 family transporter protein n=1 Tax=Bifidobacterium parmae TaxID=361854 RepID=A0A2N5J5N8_9BIFI|nr:ABC-2 transporter permease [Bifidobacterium parmae]PLS29497.1 ABC-2 family transporter protein [Bifidobacterium parmae]
MMGGTLVRNPAVAARSETSWESILRAYRMDWCRISSPGRLFIPSIVVLLPGFVLLIAVAGGDVRSDGGGAAYAAVSAAFVWMYMIVPMYAFMYEQQGGSARLGGLMPVTRRGQVAARYLLVLTCTALVTVSWLLAAAVQVAFGMADVASIPPSVAVTAGQYLITQAFLCPLLYRFSTRKALLWFAASALIGFIVSMGSFTAAMRTTSSDALGGFVGAFNDVVAMLAGHPAASATAFVLFSLIALAVSYRLSVRIYEGREL